MAAPLPARQGARRPPGKAGAGSRWGPQRAWWGRPRAPGTVALWAGTHTCVCTYGHQHSSNTGARRRERPCLRPAVPLGSGACSASTGARRPVPQGAAARGPASRRPRPTCDSAPRPTLAAAAVLSRRPMPPRVKLLTAPWPAKEQCYEFFPACRARCCPVKSEKMPSLPLMTKAFLPPQLRPASAPGSAAPGGASAGRLRPGPRRRPRITTAHGARRAARAASVRLFSASGTARRP